MTGYTKTGRLEEHPFLYWLSAALWCLLNFPVWWTFYKISQSGTVSPLVDLGGLSFGLLGWLTFQRFTKRPPLTCLRGLGLATLIGTLGCLIWALLVMLGIAGIARILDLNVNADGDRGYLVFLVAPLIGILTYPFAFLLHWQAMKLAASEKFIQRAENAKRMREARTSGHVPSRMKPTFAASPDGIFSPGPGQTTLTLSLMLVLPYFLELVLVIFQHMIKAAAGGYAYTSLTFPLVVLVLVGSFSIRFASTLAVVSVFRPGLTWDRKVALWMLVISAELVHQFAWRISLVKP